MVPEAGNRRQKHRGKIVGIIFRWLFKEAKMYYSGAYAT
jgi:hypothetical protein